MAVPVLETGWTTPNTGGVAANGLTVTVPSGLTTGDLWLIVCGDDADGDSNLWDAHADFDEVISAGDGTSDSHMRGYAKIAGASESSVVIGHSSANDELWAFSLRISGVASTSAVAINQSSATAGSATTAYTIGGVTPDADDTLIIYATCHDGGDTTWSVNSGDLANWTQEDTVYSGSGANDACGSFGTKNVAPASGVSTGTVTIDSTTGDGVAGLMIAIAPAAGGSDVYPYTGSGGAVSGGSADESATTAETGAGGAVSAGSADESSTHAVAAVGGATAGGAAATEGPATGLGFHLATYDPVTYLVGDEIVSGTPTFVHTATIYAEDMNGAWQSFSVNKRVVKGGRYVSDSEIYADDGTGTLLDPLPMTVYQPAAENLALYSNDFSDVFWGTYKASVNLNAGVYDLVVNNTETYGEIRNGTSIPISVNTVYTSSWEVRKGTLNWVRVAINIQDANTDSSPYAYIYFDINNGAVGSLNIVEDLLGGFKTMVGNIEPLDNGFYLCSITWEVNSNSDPVANRIVQIATANGDLDNAIPAANGTDVQFSIRQAQAVQLSRTVGPIYTTSSTAATDEIINTYPATNWSNSEGPIYIEVDNKMVNQDIILNDGVAVVSIIDGAIVKDADGGLHYPSLSVLNSSGTSFDVSDVVLDSDGNEFTVI